MKSLSITLLASVLIFTSCEKILTDKTKELILQPDATAGKDARVDTWHADNNLGERGDLMIKYWTIYGEIANTRAFIEFDLSSIPANSTIDSAKLSLYHWPDNDHSTLSGSNVCWIQRVIEPWNENTITWNNQPATTTVNQSQLPESFYATQDYVDIDVTQLVQDIVDNSSASFGFMIILKVEDAYRALYFSSSDYMISAKHPKIVVNYTLP